MSLREEMERNAMIETIAELEHRANPSLEGYDDIVTFGHVLADTIFLGSDEPMQNLLGYFEKPHKWETELQKWRELGGTLDAPCLRQFEDWYDNKDMPQDDDEQEQVK